MTDEQDFPQGTPLRLLAEHHGRRGWQLVATQWHRDRKTGRAGDTPLRGLTGAAPFLTPDEVSAKVDGLVLHLEGGPDCTGRSAKAAARPSPFVTLIDVDHYGPKHGGDSLVEGEMLHGPLPGTFSVTARGPWQPSRRMAFRHDADLVIPDSFFASLGGSIETVRTGHRFTWTSPSIHVRRGQVVGPVLWYDQDHNVVGMPHVDQLAELPAPWVSAIREHNAARAVPAINREGLAPGEATPITEGRADGVVNKLAQKLHSMAPAGGEFRSTVYGLAAALARREAARGGTPAHAAEQARQLFREHPLQLRTDTDDERWIDEGITAGWAQPWRFDAAADQIGLVPIELGTPGITERTGLLATEDEINAFLATYTRYTRPDRLGRRSAWAKSDPPGSLWRHGRCLVEDALAGYYPAVKALDALTAAYAHHGGDDPGMSRRIVAVALGAVLMKVAA